MPKHGRRGQGAEVAEGGAEGVEGVGNGREYPLSIAEGLGERSMRGPGPNLGGKRCILLFWRDVGTSLSIVSSLTLTDCPQLTNPGRAVTWTYIGLAVRQWLDGQRLNSDVVSLR